MVDEKLIEKMWCNVPEAPEFRENIEIVEVSEPGYVHFTMDIPESLGNYRGGIHGARAISSEKSAVGSRPNSFGVNNVCNSASINFFKAVPCCKVDVTTEPLHKGRSTAVIRVTTREAATASCCSSPRTICSSWGRLNKCVEAAGAAAGFVGALFS